ncbi:beta-alanyl-bioamine nonribosomal peptide synthetase ebony [Palaemon carinicauda]|uniref:beta-alanyl-bioamine nonribosomal peptide synthetase ebony n=1 Tax=Palaemon carinicauda TaxID=392227 RepID=UPI0035B5BF34
MVLEGPIRHLPQVVALPRLFESAVLARPTSPALKDASQETWLTYSDVNRNANALARCILRRLKGVTCSNPDGDRVIVVCMPPTSQLVTTLLAIHKAGGAYLPVDVTFPESRVAHILKDSKPALLLAHGRPQAVQFVNSSPQVENNVPVFHLEDLQSELRQESHEDLSEEEVGYAVTGDTIMTVLYTSGSTGVPKGVRVPHKAALNRLAWQWENFPYYEDEVCCFKTALTFVDSISEMFGPLLTGHRVVVVPKSMTVAVDELVSVLQREKVGRLVLVPSLLRSILLHCSSDDGQTLLSHLRLWVCSGEIFPPDLLQAFFQTFTDGQTICNFYGSTEVMGDVTYIQFHNSQEAVVNLINSKVPIGAPITNCKIFLLNADGEQVPDGQMGEVFAAGLNVALGYVGGAQPDKFIQNKFSDDPNYSVLYRTGDFGCVVNGNLVFEGRLDSQIKIRGHRVDMSEVQAAVQKVPGVDKSYLLCYKPGEVNQALVAFYTTQDAGLTAQALKTHVATLLQPYMLPQLVKMDDLPLLVNGKVDRQKLLKIYESKTEGDLQEIPIDLEGVASEQKEAAKVLLQTVGKVLGPAVTATCALSIKTNFFQIGGNSLNSVLTVTSLRDLGYNVGIGQFLKAETLGEVLCQMNKIKDGGKSQETCNKSGNTAQYVCKPFDYDHIQQVLRLISESFSKKGDLEIWLKTEPWEYVQMLTPLMPIIIKQGLSFVVLKPDTSEVVAVALNFDVHDEPPVDDVSPKLAHVLNFLESCEEPVRNKLPEGVGNVIHSFMMGTLLELGPAENVELIQIMEEENLRLATSKGFKAVFTTNTSDLTQQVCDDLLSYEVLGTTQVNTWVAPDGTRPFAPAPNSQRAVTTVKYV